MKKLLVFVFTLSVFDINAQLEIFFTSGYQGAFNKTRFSGSQFAPPQNPFSGYNVNNIYYTSFGSGIYNSLGISYPIHKQMSLAIEGFYNFYTPRSKEYSITSTSLEGTTVTQYYERINFKNKLLLPSLSIKIKSIKKLETNGKIGIALPFFSSFQVESTSKTISSPSNIISRRVVYHITPCYNIGSYLELNCSYPINRHWNVYFYLRNINKSIEFKKAILKVNEVNDISNLDKMNTSQKEFEYIKTKDELVPFNQNKPSQLFSSTYSFSSLGIGLRLSYVFSK